MFNRHIQTDFHGKKFLIYINLKSTKIQAGTKERKIKKNLQKPLYKKKKSI